MEIRTGIGYDIHRTCSGRKLVLCGVEIHHKFGLDGHSDADVGLHALSDAILSALAMPDIGTFFPDDQQATEDIDSQKILSFVKNEMLKRGFCVGNISIVIIAESPKLNQFFDQMRNKLAQILEISPAQVGITAKTHEKLGDIGQEHAIAALANVLLQKICKDR